MSLVEHGTCDVNGFLIRAGHDITIAELAWLVGKTVGYRGRIAFDTSKPDGTPRKLLEVSKLAALGWRASTPLAEGLRRTYAAYLEEHGANAMRQAERRSQSLET